MNPPLLEGVIEIEGFVQVAPDPIEHELFRVHRPRNWFAECREQCLGGSNIELAAEELFQRVEINGEGEQLAANKRTHLVVRGDEVGETRQVAKQFLVVGAEVVRAVVVNEDAVACGGIVAVAGDVGPPVHHEYVPAKNRRGPFREHASTGPPPHTSRSTFSNTSAPLAVPVSSSRVSDLVV